MQLMQRLVERRAKGERAQRGRQMQGRNRMIECESGLDKGDLFSLDKLYTIIEKSYIIFAYSGNYDLVGPNPEPLAQVRQIIIIINFIIF